jgi:hypothetical protein
MNKNIMNAVMPEALNQIKQGNCPICKNPTNKFRDDLSKREFKISGLCQTCQDKTFGRGAK